MTLIWNLTPWPNFLNRFFDLEATFFGKLTSRAFFLRNSFLNFRRSKFDPKRPQMSNLIRSRFFFLQIFWCLTGHFEKKKQFFFLYFWKRGYYFTFLVTYYFSASENSVRVAIGFTAGQIQIIDMATRYFFGWRDFSNYFQKWKFFSQGRYAKKFAEN